MQIYLPIAEISVGVCFLPPSTICTSPFFALSTNSLSLDNLVQLYRLQKGQGQPNPNAGPSPEFQQTQRAQQIPSPMGVQTGQGGGNDARSDSDKIMDNMITDYNSKNPW